MIKKIISLALVLALLMLSVCSCRTDDDTPSDTDVPSSNVGDVDTSFGDKDLSGDYDEDAACKITFSDSGAKIDGKGAVADGTSVNIGESGTYIICGSCADGSLTVDCGKGNKAQLVLSGVELTSKSGSAINIKSGKKITITLADGTSSTLSDASTYPESETDNADAAIFSKSDLVINGGGSLTVNGNYAHGIVSKDTLDITGGDINVNSVKSGICGKDSLRITGAVITVNAGTDALKSTREAEDSSDEAGYIYIKDGEYHLTAYKDALQAEGIIGIDGGSFEIKTTATSSSISSKGIKGGSGIKISGGSFNIISDDDAVHSNGDILISGGDFVISTGDDGVHSDTTLEITGGTIKIKKSYEGLEGKEILISGGNIDITSSDDGINAAGGNDQNSGVGGRPGNDFFFGGSTSSDGKLVISGGYIIMHIEGDGLDSNGTLEVSGGTVIIDGPSSGGNGSIDYDVSGKITGGLVIGIGSSDMAENFSDATQGSVLVTFNGYASAGTLISICDEEGHAILAFTSTKSFSSAVFSAPELSVGSTYTICMNGTSSALDENGFGHNVDISDATSLGSITLSKYIYGSGNGMMGGGGGMPGGGGGGHGPGGRP